MRVPSSTTTLVGASSHISQPLRLSPVAYDAARSVHRSLLRRHPQPGTPLTADSGTLTAFLTDLNLHEFRPLLARLPAGAFDGASGPPLATGDLRRFLVAVGRAASDNPALLGMLADCRAALARPSDEEVHRVVHYCLCLHLITRELAASPELAAAVLAHQQRALRSASDWWKYLSAFEHAKLITLERALIFFGKHRAQPGTPGHLPIPPNFGRVGLPFNVAEAVIQDALVFRKDSNAWAGVPLVLARPGRAGKAASLSDDGRRAVRMHLPFPKAWKDLYITWNLAFTANYQDAPYFSAALLCPCIAGAPPDEFMFHRTFALHLHCTSQIRARSRLKVPPGGRVQAERNWARQCREAGLVDLWGRQNLRAAHAYYQLCAPQLGWSTTAWHREVATPLLDAQAARLAEQGERKGVVVPRARPMQPAAPLPLAGDQLRPGVLPPWRSAVLAANVVTLAASLTLVAPLTLVAFAPAAVAVFEELTAALAAGSAGL